VKNAVVAVSLLIGFASTSYAADFLLCRSVNKEEKISGYVRSKDIIMGISGNINKIRLWVGESLEGPYIASTVLCARANQTLGFCAPVNVGDYIVASGDGYTLENDLYPIISLSIKPSPSF
jgi:hypothetical protein